MQLDITVAPGRGRTLLCRVGRPGEKKQIPLNSAIYYIAEDLLFSLMWFAQRYMTLSHFSLIKF